MNLMYSPNGLIFTRHALATLNHFTPTGDYKHAIHYKRPLGSIEVTR